jgi:CubicO group peptidase (beta-lactamase class C family)
MRSIKTYIGQAAAEGAFPGAAWLVGGREGVLERGAAGVLGRGLGPAEPDTIYDLASLTKIFVTLALMRQLEDGLVSLEDTVGEFLPAWRNSPKGDITIYALLTHTSPIPALSEFYRKCGSREELLEAILRGPVREDSPGRVEYTCEGFIVLGEILSAIDGTSLDLALRRRVLEPLGMEDTCFNPPAELTARIAPTEDCPWRGKVLRGQVHDENAAVMGGISGNAGLFSTVDDLAKIARALLFPPAGEAPFLRRATVDLMTRNHTAGKGQNRGLGWILPGPGAAAAGDFMSSLGFGHTGFTGTSLWIDPGSGLYGILFSNRIHPGRDNNAIFRVRRIFHNLMALRCGRDSQ